MTREVFLEMCLRQIYGGHPSDDATITRSLINTWLEPAIAVAARVCYTDSLKLDGIAYVNNTFYTTYKGLSVTADEHMVYKVELPHLPVGIGANEGVSTLQFKDSTTKEITLPLIWIDQKQRTYYQTMRTIPNRLLCYQEGKYLYAISEVMLNFYTATVTMISGGRPTDLQSELNVPPDYIPHIIEYLKQQLGFEKAQPKDLQNDGIDLA